MYFSVLKIVRLTISLKDKTTWTHVFHCNYCLPKEDLFFYSFDYILKNNFWKFNVPTAFRRTSAKIYCLNL